MSFFEDFSLGDQKPIGCFEFTSDRASAFAEKFDPKPMSVGNVEDHASYPASSVVSGWHVAAAAMRVSVDGRKQENGKENDTASGTWGPSPGFRDLRWYKPVRAGDTIHYSRRVVAMRASTSRPEWGVLECEITGVNQVGDLVYSVLAAVFIRRRSAGDCSN